MATAAPRRWSARRSPARRDELFIVSKVLPHNASRHGTIAACERSLKRLRTDRIDLYLLHWRGSHPLAETVAGLPSAASERARSATGRQQFRPWRHGGTGARLPAATPSPANQVLYNLNAARHRIRSAALVPRARHPDHGLFAGRAGPHARRNGAGRRSAPRHGATPAQIALAWLLRQDGHDRHPEGHERRSMSARTAARSISS